MDQVIALEQRRRQLRTILFIIILATLPFYCAGFLLLGLQGSGRVDPAAPTGTPTTTPIGREVSPTPLGGALPSITPFTMPLTRTLISPLQPTPGQFIPVQPTRYLSPTPFIIVIPTSTNAPTLTPYPTLTPAPTLTPYPTDIPPLPTFTETPTPTNTSEFLPPASDTPAFIDVTADPILNPGS